MLDIGWSELLVIAVILIVVVGPKDLPPMLRAFGKMMSRVRKTAGEFRSQFDEALREAELDDVRQTIQDAKRFNPANTLREAINPLRQMGEEIRADLRAATSAVEAPSPLAAEPDAPAQEMPGQNADAPSPLDALASEEPIGGPVSKPSPAPVAAAATAPAVTAAPTVSPPAATASVPPAAVLSSPPPELIARPAGIPAQAGPVEMADPKPKRARKAPAKPPGPAMAPIETIEEPAEAAKPKRRVAAAKAKPEPSVETVAAVDSLGAKPKRARQTAARANKTTTEKDSA